MMTRDDLIIAVRQARRWIHPPTGFAAFGWDAADARPGMHPMEIEREVGLTPFIITYDEMLWFRTGAVDHVNGRPRPAYHG